MAKGWICLFLLSMSFLMTTEVQGATYSNLDSLVTTLFSGYKPELRPFVDDTTATVVYMGIWLASIQDLDEIDQSLTFSAFLYIEWNDPRLVWTPASYNNTYYFAYPQQYLWIPDITIINSMETMTELGFDRNYLYVIDTGEVVWLPGGVYKTSCDIDITHYPFDTQVCSIVFSTLVSTLAEIDLEADSVFSTHLDLYSESGTWDLVSFTTTTAVDTSNKARVAFQVKIKRLATYYIVSVVFPVLFLSLTATLVFALPADSGEKMGTSITVLLAFAVYLTIVSDNMPKTSLHVSILAMYLSVLLAETSLGVVLSVWILNLHYRDDQRPPGPYLRLAAFHMQRIMCKRLWADRVTPVEERHSSYDSRPKLSMMRTSENIIDDVPTIPQSSVPPTPAPVLHLPKASYLIPEMMSWKEISVTYDRFLFYTFSILLALLTVIFLTILGTGGK